MSKREQKRIRALERRVSVLEKAVLLKYMEANFTETKAAVESRIKESVFNDTQTWWSLHISPAVDAAQKAADRIGSAVRDLTGPKAK